MSDEEEMRQLLSATAYAIQRSAENRQAAMDELQALRAENARLREALEQIAGCESHAPGDVVSVARAAIAGEVKP
jgi:prefoldin subunit 5